MKRNMLWCFVVGVGLGLIVIAGTYALVLAAPDAKVAVKTTGNVTLAPAPAPASDVPVAEQVSVIVQLFKTHNWRLAGAACLTFIVFIWRRYDKWVIAKVPSWVLPWIAAGLGLLATLPAHLSKTPFVWWQFLIDGFVTSAEAAMFWSLLGKNVLPKIFGDVPTKT